jgi:hypothetical protein
LPMLPALCPASRRLCRCGRQTRTFREHCPAGSCAAELVRQARLANVVQECLLQGLG